MPFRLWQLLGFFLSKLLASLMRNYFPKRTSGAPLLTLSKLYDVPVGFVFTPTLLRQCIAIFAVAEGWLLLDIGWFVLFLLYFVAKKSSAFSESKRRFKPLWGRKVELFRSEKTPICGAVRRKFVVTKRRKFAGEKDEKIQIIVFQKRRK